ncbi:MAG: AAA family ATPase [Chitinophagales bacterium]
MSPKEEALQNLLDALKFSPDNLPLRMHIAESLFGLKRFAEAEEHFRKALEINPRNQTAKIGLARSFHKSGKNSAAFVIVEELLNNGTPPPKVFILHANLLYESGDRMAAKEEYEKAVALDKDLKDLHFESKLKSKTTSYGADEGKVSVDLPDEEEMGEIEKPKITFEDVGGMDKVKEEIELKIISPLKFPDLYKAYGKKIGGGILMYGPPGCGKTHLARATAGEVKAGFLSVGINDILDMWMGNSEKNLHQIFELARNQAPCVLFFDEVDALGASRTDMKRSGGRSTINQFLSEMDGVDSNNEGVLILGATNTPWNLDVAFRRPGRFDRFIFVAPPDETARKSILDILLKDKPIEKIDTAKIAKNTKYFSGADLKSLIDVAIESKLRESMRAGKAIPLSQKDLLAAAKTVRPSTREWFNTAKNYAMYANDSGLYDDILKYLKINK